MLTWTLFGLLWTFGFTADLPAFPPHCEYDGKMYFPGDIIPTSNSCETCHCEFEQGYSGDLKKRCIYVDIFTPMCYNPIDNGPVACYRYVCPANIPAFPPHCEYDGKMYFPGDIIPTSNSCEKCHCKFEQGYSGNLKKWCIYVDIVTPMCYNPIDNGPVACYRYVCPVRNCKTPSGHVLLGDEERSFLDDGNCRCPPQSKELPGKQWKPENGVAECSSVTTQTVPP